MKIINNNEKKINKEPMLQTGAFVTTVVLSAMSGSAIWMSKLPCLLPAQNLQYMAHVS